MPSRVLFRLFLALRIILVGCLGVVIVAMLAAYLTRTHLLGAPVPAPKPLKKVSMEELVGAWQMRWGDCCWMTILAPNGQYTTSSGKSNYVGSWHYHGGVLTVSERAVESDTNGSFTWRFYLYRNIQGNFDGYAKPKDYEYMNPTLRLIRHGVQ